MIRVLSMPTGLSPASRWPKMTWTSASPSISSNTDSATLGSKAKRPRSEPSAA